MQNENETPEEVNSTSENENIDAQGTTEAPATGSHDVEESESTTDVVSKEEYEKLQKNLEKMKMERNMLRNKTEEEHKARLEEEGEFKTLYEETKAELEAIRQQDEQRDIAEYNNNLREQFIDEYSDPKVKEAAKALLKNNPNNLWWNGEAQNEIEAKEQVFKQLDAIKETLGILGDTEGQEESAPSVHANNPSTPIDSELSRYNNMSFEEMREALAAEGLIADSR